MEASKSCLGYAEYAAKVRENVVHESVRSTFNLQWQVAQACQAMSWEEITRVKMLEKTKDMLVCKLERVTQADGGTFEKAEAQIEEITQYIERIEEQI